MPSPSERAEKVWLAQESTETKAEEIEIIADEIRAVIEECRQVAKEVEGYYPENIFIPPPPGEHGQTVDACSARGCRLAARLIADKIRALTEETDESP